jgi:putative flippase GtrA
MIALVLRLVDWGSGLVGLDVKKGRFLAIGGVNTVFGIGIYPVFLWLFRDVAYGYLVALGAAQATSLVFAYVTHKFFVFQTTGNIWREFARFSTFYLTGYAINWVALPILVEFFLLDALFAQIGFTIVMIVLSYFWHNYVTFKPATPADHSPEQ